jgi:hypothetical protein
MSLRLSEAERGRLVHEAEQNGVGVSTVVRQIIRQYFGLTPAPVGDVIHDAVDDHERRLSRLEEMAGL